MKFSVVGLPHYTIWHLYEPSIDDIRHMEEMEQERQAKEAEEKAKQERVQKIKDQFDDRGSQWAKDKSDIQNMAKKESVNEGPSKEANDGKEAQPSQTLANEKVH